MAPALGPSPSSRRLGATPSTRARVARARVAVVVRARSGEGVDDRSAQSPIPTPIDGAAAGGDPARVAPPRPRARATVVGTVLGAAAFAVASRAPIARAAPPSTATASTSTSTSRAHSRHDESSSSSSSSSSRGATRVTDLASARPAAKKSGHRGELSNPTLDPSSLSWTSFATAVEATAREAEQKLATQFWLYLTIPVVAGVLNWLTNALAVKMIFSPEEYVGLDIKRWPETPAGFLGWQGIVPCKVRKMSETMVDLMTKRLLDVREVFGRLDKAACGELLLPGVDAIASGVVGDITEKGKALHWVKSSGALAVAGKSAWLTKRAAALARRHGAELVAAVLGEMQQRVPEVWDVKTQVVGAMTRDKGIIVELFQRCGREEFIFIRRSGLYFGFLFGIVQMFQWLLWDPWWSLAVGGAAVGYATNWLALTLMFSPVNPVRLPFGLTLHGAFLRRQHEVSGEFAELLRRRVLTAELIWKEILTSPGTRDVFRDILRRKTMDQMEKARAFDPAIGLAAAVVGSKSWNAVVDAVATRVEADLPKHLPLVYAYSDERLDLEKTLREKMRGLSGEEFEGVLHPVFQEDELTLILVGAFLGLLAGFAQAIFVF